MYDIKDEFVKLFTSCSSFHESLVDLDACFKTTIKQMPVVDDLLSSLSKINNNDIVELSFYSIASLTLKNNEEKEVINKYNYFISSNELDDEVEIRLHIDKNQSESISIYNFDYIENFFYKKSTNDLLVLFSMLLKDKNKLCFVVYDKMIEIYTDTISFLTHDKKPINKEIDRNSLLERCNRTSLFLNRNDIKLIPQDFIIRSCYVSKTKIINDIFSNIETILEFVYTANNAYIANDCLVLQFDPVGKAFEFKLLEIQMNPIWRDIYEWIYDNDATIERATIARNIISSYCETEYQIQGIKQEIVSCIKSNYTIYLKNIVEKYIDLKKNIADNIVENTNQIQNLSHELSDSLRDNFVAILAFLMASFLTNSIDFSMLLNKTVPNNFKLIFIVFIALSFVYLVAVYYISNEKWKWIEQDYRDLKDNYSCLLDNEDIEEMFKHDRFFNRTKESYRKFKRIVFISWIIILVLLIVTFIRFTF